MSATITPPTPEQVPPTPAPQPRGSATAIAIIAIVIGAVLILGTVVFGILGALRTAATQTIERSASADDVESVETSTSAGELDVVFERVDEATLTVEGPGADDWQLDRSGDQLTVSVDRGWFGGWSWFGSEGDRAVLTLPMELTGIDATFDVSAGSVEASGAFGDVRLELSAGEIDLSGVVASLDTHVSAGTVNLDVDAPRTVVIDVSAGTVKGQLTGAPSDSLDIGVSAGSVHLALPDGTYRVTSDVSAGTFDNNLDTSSGATAIVDVRISAGEVVLRQD